MTAALARMRPRDRGSVVNVGSALAIVGVPLQSAYCASKFACRGFFESAPAELSPEKSRARLSMVHRPAVNTPQFDWCEATLDRHPQPVPPIYQPEVPAQLTVAAALDGRPAKVIGSWNKMLLLTGRLSLGLGNHHAALGGWDSQLTNSTAVPDRPANLYRPADRDHDRGTHGIFGDQAGRPFDSSFLETLPVTARTLTIAADRTVGEKAKSYRALAAGRRAAR